MNDYPTTMEARQRLRAQIKRTVMAEAERRAQQRDRSLKCAGDRFNGIAPLHADVLGGCANTGSGCICECHDAREGRPTWT